LAVGRRRGDGFALVGDWTVSRQVLWDAAVAGEFHNKNLTCVAVMSHFAPIASSVLLTIACKSSYCRLRFSIL